MKSADYHKRLESINDFASKIYDNALSTTRENIIKALHYAGLSKLQIIEEIKGVLLPGCEHAIPISCILHELARQPDIQKNLEDNDYDDASLMNIIEEGLRMYPLYPILARCPVKDTDRYTKGTEPYCCPYVIGRNPNYYDKQTDIYLQESRLKDILMHHLIWVIGNILQNHML